MQFYRTKMRGDKLLQIEFNEPTDLGVSGAQRGIVETPPAEKDKPSSSVVAIFCRQHDGGILRIRTGIFNEGRWNILGQSP